MSSYLAGIVDGLRCSYTRAARCSESDVLSTAIMRPSHTQLKSDEHKVSPHFTAVKIERYAEVKTHRAGLPSHGRKTIAVLSKEVAASGQWKDTSDNELQETVDELTERKKAKLRPVTEKMVGHEVQSTMGILEAEVSEALWVRLAGHTYSPLRRQLA